MRVWVLLIVFLPLLASGQDSGIRPGGREKLQYYLNLYNSPGGSASNLDDVSNFVEKLERKRPSFRSERDFLTYIFNKTHQRFLRNYTQYASFSETLDKKTYNCLTATALYALMLEHFGVKHQVIETNYHIFLLAQTDKGQVLIETTDPANGFVTDANEVVRRIALYRKNDVQLTASASKSLYRYQVDLYQQINLDQLLGLMHYNLSIVAYNEHNFSMSIDQLAKAITFYPSTRTEEFSKVILLTVMEGKLDARTRALCLEKIQNLRKSQFMVRASTN